MAKQERYTIGPGLLRDIRETIRRVDVLAPHTSGPTQGTRYWDMQRPAQRTDVFRICTFTGSWSIDTAKTVTFKYQTTTPNTVSAQNVLFPLPELSSNTASPTVCAIAKDGTAWQLISVLHANHTALTDVLLTPTNLQFSRRSVLTISATAATAGISVASCNTAQASPQALSYFQ